MKKFLSALFLSIPMLSSCSGLFKPKTMTIEYDEEVKLHDGSMIWVHITRHYYLVGGALGDSGSLDGGSYMPTEVEISWDTGFKGVERKSLVFYRQILTIDKINNEWYVYGATKSNLVSSTNSKVCNNIGTLYFNGDTCLVRVNFTGNFIMSPKNEIYKLSNLNILFADDIEEIQKFRNNKLSWQQKLDMQHGKSKDERTLNLKLFSTEGMQQ